MAEQDLETDYPDRGGPVEEPPGERGKKEETIDQEHKVPEGDEETGAENL